ncbi:MAG: UDP-N-acetylmuramoyl-L-alanine--D-glutamate ligase [Desulfobacterales bacterium]|nr:MAG: UDP-N-acetylmuramoyl-L-alanine--D-glutamate ligase [Desulfobacterales bacterium]
MKLAGKKIVVAGLGKTGVAVARFLKNRRAAVVVTDMAPENKLASQVQEIQAMGIPMELGGHRTETFTAADLIVLSPGVSHMIEPVIQARQRAIPVMGEVELASRYIRRPIVAVTGTNGKTTTTELLGDMLERSGLNVFVGGNIGNPLIDYVDGEQQADVIVAEVSSFQLDTIESFRARVGVLLNITADHLDRYPNFAAYAASKMRLFENQQAGDFAVLNGSDPLIRSLTGDIKARKLIYPNPAADEEGAILNNHHITLHSDELSSKAAKSRNLKSGSPAGRRLFRAGGRNPISLNLANIKLRGRHNLENACAAGLAAMAVGARPQSIQDTLDHFKGSAHRLEYVDVINDVEFFNDSKATNVNAVMRALECFDSPVVLIMGGLDKGGNFKELREVVSRHTQKLIVIGRAADLIHESLKDITATSSADSMADAVNQAYSTCNPGDVVLLSPGCASFDMYDNYAQRGDDFRKAVEKLKSQTS